MLHPSRAALPTWTPEREARALRLFLREGFTAAQVADALGCGFSRAAVVGKIDKSIPGAQTALAALFQAADAAAASLETQAAAGFADLVAGAVEEAGGTVANLISASGLDLTGKAVLTAADVATVTAAQAIAHNAISVATARLLGQAAPAAGAAASGPEAPAAA